MSAEIIPIGRGCRILRGPDVESARLARIKLQRRAAYNRAVYGGFHKADLAAFGPLDRILMEGPDPERELYGPGAPKRA